MRFAPRRRRQIASNRQNLTNVTTPSVATNSWGTKSDVISWVINLLLAGFTILLFFLTRSSLAEARRATDEAHRGNDISDLNYQLSLRQFAAFNEQRQEDLQKADADEKKRSHKDSINSSYQDSIFKIQLQINQSTLASFQKQATIAEQQLLATGPKLIIDSFILRKENDSYSLTVALKNVGQRELLTKDISFFFLNERKDYFDLGTLFGSKYLYPTQSIIMELPKEYSADTIEAFGTKIFFLLEYYDPQLQQNLHLYEAYQNFGLNKRKNVVSNATLMDRKEISLSLNFASKMSSTSEQVRQKFKKIKAVIGDINNNTYPSEYLDTNKKTPIYKVYIPIN